MSVAAEIAAAPGTSVRECGYQMVGRGQRNTEIRTLGSLTGRGRRRGVRQRLALEAREVLADQVHVNRQVEQEVERVDLAVRGALEHLEKDREGLLDRHRVVGAVLVHQQLCRERAEGSFPTRLVNAAVARSIAPLLSSTSFPLCAARPPLLVSLDASYLDEHFGRGHAVLGRWRRGSDDDVGDLGAATKQTRMFSSGLADHDNRTKRSTYFVQAFQGQVERLLLLVEPVRKELAVLAQRELARLLVDLGLLPAKPKKEIKKG